MTTCHYFHYKCETPTGVNFGDNLATSILTHLYSGPIQLAETVDDQLTEPMHLITGSILQVALRPNSIVWGSGFMHDQAKPACTPRQICAVRGTHTRRLFEHAGIPCPQIYGDPGLLLPHLFPAPPAKSIQVGILPHYIDYDQVKLQVSNPDVRVIDLTNPDIKQVAEDIASCKYTISSSLHGLVASHAYNVPSAWVQFSDKVCGKGFKFRDYYSAFDLDVSTSLSLHLIDLNDVDSIIEKIKQVPQPSPAKVQEVQTNLLQSCPFA